MAMGMLLYATGQRPGSIVISRGYEALDEAQCLKVKVRRTHLAALCVPLTLTSHAQDVEVFVNGWKEGEGLDFSLFLKLRWAKYKRDQESE